MVQLLNVVINRRSNREHLSKANLRFELLVDEPQMASLLEALQDSLSQGEPGHGPRTLKGLEADLELYERLHRMAFGQPNPAWLEQLAAQYGPGEFRRVVEAARQRWTV